MSYPRTDAGFREMIRQALTTKELAVGIARKGLGPIVLGEGTATFGAPTDPWGTYAQVDELGGGTHSALGSTWEYPASSDFELRPPSMRRYADWNGVDEVMLLATVTEVAGEGASLYLTLEYDADPTGGVDVQDVPFVSASPTVPLDTLGVHLSTWQRIDWPEDSLVLGERPALATWRVDNPSATGGSVGLGLCQLFARGDDDS